MNLSLVLGLKGWRFRSRRFHYGFLSLLTLLLGFELAPSLLQPTQAQYVPARSSTTNPWQYASFPVENFQAYTSPYGYRVNPVSGQPQFHRGLDLAAPIGSYVRNWWSGYIVEVSDNTACGTMIQVQSGQWTHIYCHLMGQVQKNGNLKYFVDREGGIILQERQEIPAGARMGRVGMTGRTTGPHLHWGLKHNGQYVDPALVLREMYNQQASL